MDVVVILSDDSDDDVSVEEAEVVSRVEDEGPSSQMPTPQRASPSHQRQQQQAGAGGGEIKEEEEEEEEEQRQVADAAETLVGECAPCLEETPESRVNGLLAVGGDTAVPGQTHGGTVGDEGQMSRQQHAEPEITDPAGTTTGAGESSAWKFCPPRFRLPAPSELLNEARGGGETSDSPEPAPLPPRKPWALTLAISALRLSPVTKPTRLTDTRI